jgi:hypothetical protein
MVRMGGVRCTGSDRSVIATPVIDGRPRRSKGGCMDSRKILEYMVAEHKARFGSQLDAVYDAAEEYVQGGCVPGTAIMKCKCEHPPWWHVPNCLGCECGGWFSG